MAPGHRYAASRKIRTVEQAAVEWAAEVEEVEENSRGKPYRGMHPRREHACNAPASRY
jgi:hypothetical protein